MKIDIPKGRYVLAVSGGVDSMVLMDVLAKRTGLELIVAHFIHGIRDKATTKKEEEMVASETKKRGLKLETGRGNLGPAASEEKARNARYKFLQSIKQRYDADAIITAHHQDDLIETALINIMRGTGWRGLTAISDNPGVLRPLLGITKSEIIRYADAHGVKWREDESNQDRSYLRNRLRLDILKNLSDKQRRLILENIERVAKNKTCLVTIIETLSQEVVKGGQIDRQKFAALPTEVGHEMLAFLLRRRGLREFDKKTIERTAMAVKTAKPGTAHKIQQGYELKLSPDTAVIANTL
jgi:tRNA(Ile)-lysidine synthetase-like protein